MIKEEKIIFTGGSGLLGSEMKKKLPNIKYPSSSEFNILNFGQMENYVSKGKYELIIHAAAFTSPPKIEQDPLKGLETNIIGTCNVVKLCIKYQLKLFYISTDYVFDGNKGNYKEDDPVYPVNKYAWSKLGGECAVRLYDNSLIIRTSFGPNIFPYEGAFIDQWTSRENVKVIADKIISLIDMNINGTIHIGGSRRTVFEYALSLDPTKNIKPLSIKDMNFALPKDTSLNCNKFNLLINKNKIKE